MAWSKIAKNVATTNPDLHTTIGQGTKADGTGTGDYVSAADLMTHFFADVDLYDDFLFTDYTPLLNLMQSTKISNYMGQTAPGQPTTFRWQAPAELVEDDAECEATVKKVLAGAKTINEGHSLTFAESLNDCKCPPIQCNGRTDMFYAPSVQMKRARAARAIARRLETKAAAFAITGATALTDVYNQTTRYGQILGGLAQIRNTFELAGLGFNPTHFAILMNSLTDVEVQLEPSERYRYSYDQKTWESLMSGGVAGFIQGVPVFIVSDTLINHTDAWTIIPIGFGGYGITCEKEEIDKIMKGDGKISFETGYAKKIYYGFDSMLDILASGLGVTLTPIKGKALKVVAP